MEARHCGARGRRAVSGDARLHGPQPALRCGHGRDNCCLALLAFQYYVYIALRGAQPDLWCGHERDKSLGILKGAQLTAIVQLSLLEVRAAPRWLYTRVQVTRATARCPPAWEPPWPRPWWVDGRVKTGSGQLLRKHKKHWEASRQAPRLGVRSTFPCLCRTVSPALLWWAPTLNGEPEPWRVHHSEPGPKVKPCESCTRTVRVRIFNVISWLAVGWCRPLPMPYTHSHLPAQLAQLATQP